MCGQLLSVDKGGPWLLLLPRYPNHPGKQGSIPDPQILPDSEPGRKLESRSKPLASVPVALPNMAPGGRQRAGSLLEPSCG